MTNEQINVRVQECLGWTLTAEKEYPHRACLVKDGVQILVFDLPDYCSDLNACHEMEESVKPDDFSIYICRLRSVCDRTLLERVSSEHRYDVENKFAMLHASARDRAIAFLSVNGIDATSDKEVVK